MMRKLVLRLPSLIIMAISWYLSSGTLDTIPMPSVSDKLVHLVCFAGLGFFWCWWFSREAWLEHPWRHILYVTLIVAAYQKGQMLQVLPLGSFTVAGQSILTETAELESISGSAELMLFTLSADGSYTPVARAASTSVE